MDFIGHRHFNVNRLLLTWMGLWPYHNSKLIKLQRITFLLITLSLVTVQLTCFITTKFSVELLLEILFFVFIALCYVLKYTTFCVSRENIRNIIDNIQYNWSLIVSDEERKILERYTYHGKCFTLFVAAILTTPLLIFILSQLNPIILDVFISLNKTRTRQLPIRAEYFMDHERYYCFLAIHIILSSVIGSATVVATETIFALMTQQICALFKITCFQIEHIMDDWVFHTSISQRNIIIRQRIINAIQVHKRAIELCMLVISTFTTSYFILLLIGASSMVVSLFRLTAVLYTGNNQEELIFCLSCVLVHICYLYYAHHIGQEVTNQSAEVSIKIYDTPWYLIPPSTQKLLLFFLQRSTETYVPTVGGIFPASLAGFSKVMSTSLSYFMVIYSVQT